MSDNHYERLPGRGRQLGGSECLLLAADHLLLARQQLYIENYQRFFFSDIQAFTLTDSRTRELVAAVLGSLLLVLAWAIWFTDILGLEVFWSTLAIGVILASLINWFRGPGVRCHLTTALQTVELTSINRRRQAERILARLEARIHEAQADLPGPESTESQPGPEDSSRRGSAPARRRADPPPLPAVYSGFWHWLLFSLLLLDSAVTYWQLQTDRVAADFVGTTLFLIELAVVLIAILRQRVLVVARPVKALTWTALSFMLLLLVGGWVFGLYAGVASALQAANDPSMIDPMAAQAKPEALSWFSLVGTSTIGVAGLAVMRAARRRPRASGVG